MTIRLVERTGLDGTTTTIAFGRSQIPCLSATYGDKIEPENLSYMGSQQVDEQTEGPYSTVTAKIKMSAAVYRAKLMPLLQKNGFGSERLSVVIAFTHPVMGNDSDLLTGARFTGTDAATENSGKVQEVDFEMTFSQLYWGEERKTRNKLNTQIPLGASKF